MQPNTSNTGDKQQLGQKWADAKFVERVEMGVMQFAIMAKAQQGEVTRENLQQTFRGNLQMGSDHFDHCLKQLVADGHLKEQGNKYTITDDGREDVQKLQSIVQELPNVARTQGGSQPRSQQQTTTTQAGGPAGQPKGGPGASSPPNR